MNWTEHPYRDGDSFLRRLQWTNGEFWGLGSSYNDEQLIARSQDGIVWETQVVDQEATWITYDTNDSQYRLGTIIGSPSGLTTTVMASSDGDTWIPETTVSTGMADLVFTGEEYIGVGFTDVDPFTASVSQSDDGINWEIEEILNNSFFTVAYREDEQSNIVLTNGHGDVFEDVLFRQECPTCPLAVPVTPTIQAQGINPMIFTASPACGIEPYTFEWMDGQQNPLSTHQTLTIQPTLTQTEVFTVTVTDDAQNEIQNQVTVLASSNPALIDANGDGVNTIDDLYLVGQDWATNSMAFDADGDGLLTVRDLLFVSFGNSAKVPFWR